ncbi:hypothetical protein H7F15_13160 [Pontibacter sp. Tf4]|uniref:hypothetical protein n=1 Tax=Pontibacter sp. Tf4 TaxID=2761620 RepID=UPI001625ADA3|nr:hypothetical protein [Pontibacter sp. Tf4]MBB6611992.1 hypothetical protein [Pontibacter sp. Tf4]
MFGSLPGREDPSSGIALLSLPWLLTSPCLTAPEPLEALNPKTEINSIVYALAIVDVFALS